MAVKPIPDGYHSVTPYLIVDDAARAIEFYKRAFGAVELMRLPGARRQDRARRDQDRRFAGDARRRSAGRWASAARARSAAPRPAYDLRRRRRRAVRPRVAAGGEARAPVANQFYGDRTGGSSIRSATPGTSPRTSRTSRRRRSIAGGEADGRRAAEYVPDPRTASCLPPLPPSLPLPPRWPRAVAPGDLARRRLRARARRAAIGLSRRSTPCCRAAAGRSGALTEIAARARRHRRDRA